MIFISLGTQKFQFDRLLRHVDELIEEGFINEPVFAQIGNSTYQPKNYDFSNFLTQADFEEKIRESTIFLTHGGVGSITTGLKYKKKVVVYPRLAEFGEHIDDHQTQITAKYKELGYVLTASNKNELVDALMESLTFVSKFNGMMANDVISKKIDIYIEEEII